MYFQSPVWFPTKSQTKTVEGFTAKHVSATRGSHVTLTQIVIQAKVTLFTCIIFIKKKSECVRYESNVY